MKDQKPQKKCLLIIPLSFYSYSCYLKEALLQQGYDVTVSNDEYPANGIGKIMGKLGIPLLLSITSKKIKQKYLTGKSYNLILIFKGRGMSSELINYMKGISPKVIGYSFDSFKYHAAPIKWFKDTSKFFTFDYRDSKVHSIPVTELFSSLPLEQCPKEYRYEISAIIRNHSTRLTYIDKVFSHLPVSRKFIYVYEQNILTFLKNFIRNPILYIRYRKYISFKSLPYDDYARVLLQSNFTIDFAHPWQTGITIRCFEALGSATKIITNNPFISQYEHFNNSNSIVFDSSSDPNILKSHFSKITDQTPTRYHRKIDSFIEDLLR